ncbi:MAG: hypothetical protein V4485_00160 [Pseudomonadota bacterium]
MIKPTINAISLILITIFATIYCITRLYDISLEPVFRSNNKNRNWLISFAEGLAHESNQNFLNASSINKGFDNIITYGPKDIDQKYYEQHKDILSQKRGAGYWLWKPYLIKKTMSLMAEGDVLFYVDTGATLLTNTDFFINQMDKAEASVLLFKSYHKNERYTKRDTYSLMGMDEKYRDYPQIGATFIILRKSKRSEAFIDAFLKYCEDPQILTDSKSTLGEYEDFIDHRNDQSIITLLYYQDPTGILLMNYHDKGVCDKFFHHRRRAFGVSLEWLYYIYQYGGGMCNEMNFTASR